jgi:ribosomal protein S12 methylthiotransferase accessory factor
VGGEAEDVALRARGELRERVSNILAGRLAEARRETVATYEELRRAGRPAVDPSCLSSRPGTEAEDDALRRTRMLWVTGESLLTGTPTVVPAGAVFLHHRPPSGCSGAPRTGSTGVSAHTSWGAAVRHGLLEVLERDLFWRSWYGTGVRTSVLVPSLFPSALQRTLVSLGLEGTALRIEGPGGTACIVSCLFPPGGQGQSFGARAFVDDSGSTWAWALERAAYEALMVRWSLDTPAARLAWRRMAHGAPPLPRDALEHALAAFHGRGEQDCLRYWLGAARTAEPWTPPPGESTLPGPDERRLARFLADHTGQEPVAVDTTVPQVCSGEAVVVRIVAPGAHQLPGDERHARVPSSPPGIHRPPHPLG